MVMSLSKIIPLIFFGLFLASCASFQGNKVSSLSSQSGTAASGRSISSTTYKCKGLLYGNLHDADVIFNPSVPSTINIKSDTWFGKKQIQVNLKDESSQLSDVSRLLGTQQFFGTYVDAKNDPREIILKIWVLGSDGLLFSSFLADGNMGVGGSATRTEDIVRPQWICTLK